MATPSDTTLGASAPAFSALPLHDDVARALTTMHFRSPSPIQLRALPIALFGNDVIGQAKSGTGKTAVFGITIVEHVIRHAERRQQQDTGVEDVAVGDPLALILAPTREIAMQIETVVRQLSQFRPECVIRTCIGGLPVAQDQLHLAAGCHVVVGTPGRVKALVDQRALACSAIRLLVLDEVDKLMAQDFEEDIQYIAAALPERRQTLAFSATFTPDQLVAVAELMRTPQVSEYTHPLIVWVRGPDDVTTEFISSTDDLADLKKREQSNEPELWLRHVRQFYSVVQSPSIVEVRGDALSMRAKVSKLATLLSEVVFAQCMVFCNDKFRTEALATALTAQGWPAACITGSQAQATRLEVMRDFRASRSRVLVATDLMARGIDIDKVNFVVNLDLPRDPATYLHRVGRTGRFGGKISFSTLVFNPLTLLSQSEVKGIQLLARVFKMTINELPNPVPAEIFTYAARDGDNNIANGSQEDNDSVASDSAPIGDDGSNLTVETQLETVESPTMEDDEEETVVAQQQQPKVYSAPDISHAKKSPPRREACAATGRSRDPPSQYEVEETWYERWLTLL